MPKQLKSVAPEIRFKGFDDEWCTLTLGELGSVATNKRIFMHETASTGDVPFYKIGSFGREPKLFISQELFDKYKERFPFPEKGDLLFSVIGSIGRVVEYKGEDEYFQDSNIVWLQHNGAIVNSFLKQFYSFVEWSGLEGSTIIHLYNRNILETQIDLPCDAEQTQIGAYFKSLDQMIELHQRKHDRLVTLKQAMLQKMFPQDGATTPEIRFKGFEGDWEEKTLGDLGSVAMNKRIFKDQTMPVGEIPFFKIGTFGSEPDAFISKSLFEKYKDKYPYPNAGAILISASGSIGRTVEYDGSDEYFQDSNIVWLQHDEQVLDIFLKQFYLVVKWHGLEGSTIKRLYNKNILETEILLPEAGEQKKIGAYFHRLDELISKHAIQFEKLKNIKSACLEKMFV